MNKRRRQLRSSAVEAALMGRTPCSEPGCPRPPVWAFVVGKYGSSFCHQHALKKARKAIGRRIRHLDRPDQDVPFDVGESVRAVKKFMWRWHRYARSE